MTEEKLALSALFGNEKQQELVTHIPHCVELGMTVEEAFPYGVTIKLPMQDCLIGDTARGVVFGGVITTLLDQVGGSTVMCSLSDIVSIATIDLRIDYMKRATPGQALFGRGRCYRLTRNVAFVRGEADHGDPDDPFAIFTSTYMLAANPLPPGILSRMSLEDDG